MTKPDVIAAAEPPLDCRVGPQDVFPVPESGRRSLEPGPWMDGTVKPARDGKYLRDWQASDDMAYSFFRKGKWYASPFFDSLSDHQDIPWRGGVRPNGSGEPGRDS